MYRLNKILHICFFYRCLLLLHLWSVLIKMSTTIFPKMPFPLSQTHLQVSLTMSKVIIQTVILLSYRVFDHLWILLLRVNYCFIVCTWFSQSYFIFCYYLVFLHNIPLLLNLFTELIYQIHCNFCSSTHSLEGKSH